jgi:hypothetical protein
MINFLNWLENIEGKSVSEPQHKKGESTMDVDEIVEKRIMQLILELEREGKGSRQDILKSIKKVIGAESQQVSTMQNQVQSQPQNDAGFEQ